MSRLFYAMTMPGLETLAFNELRSRVADAEQVKFARGIVLFTTTASPVRLLSARTTEDIFFALAHVRSLGHGRDALRVLHSATLHADLSSALTHWCHVHGGRRPKTWRVVSQMSGTHGYRRVDAGQAVQDALYKVLPREMHFSKGRADCEF